MPKPKYTWQQSIKNAAVKDNPIQYEEDPDGFLFMRNGTGGLFVVNVELAGKVIERLQQFVKEYSD